MTFAQLVAILFQIFGPILAEWLKQLLAREGPQLSGRIVGMTSTAISDWFANIRGRLSWYEFGKKARLAVLEAVALKHATSIAAALWHSRSAPQLDGDDHQAIAQAF
jgi:hypothetical protein